MFQLKTILPILPLLISTTLAAPSSNPHANTNTNTITHSASSSDSDSKCVYYCGTHCYWASDISAAQSKGYSLHEEGRTIDDYPHVYHDYEGFDFSVSGTYYEYPILDDYEVYDGGSPGADRVIFNGEDELAGLITHTGAEDYDGFVECEAV
ncbi:hypothetical protein ASPBRDRAFT_59367 [Aspergillus brasiliensis CBS 101740]|uniref:ribonuclease T1 n=1 Tax=Aspergillus brasiliensis (strain CBS 101740 / IMI 381727 / IBT 21946) TaxID=767769 RepID=A0A1L9U5I5_ASPBC|nr:hypothetical protein ASPBRDRAFT_59367 [Aspergillus brasiliensis CBS 101740]